MSDNERVGQASLQQLCPAPSASEPSSQVRTRRRMQRKINQLHEFHTLLSSQRQQIQFTDLVADIAEHVRHADLRAALDRRLFRRERRRVRQLATAVRKYEHAVATYGAGLDIAIGKCCSGEHNLESQQAALTPPNGAKAGIERTGCECLGNSSIGSANIKQPLLSVETSTRTAMAVDDLATSEFCVADTTSTQFGADVLPQVVDSSFDASVVDLPKTRVRFSDVSPPPQSVGKKSTPPNVRLTREITTKGASENRSTKKSTRHRVVEELLQTEQAYVDNLDFLVRHYVAAAAPELLEDSDAPNTANKGREVRRPVPAFAGISGKKLFGNVVSLLRLNNDFLDRLQELTRSWDDESSILGNMLATFAGFFKIYAEYGAQQGNAAFLLHEWTQSRPRLRRFIQQTQDHNIMKPSLESLLISPIQRIPRYQLLLDTLIQKTPLSHLDRKPLETALEKMKETAAFVNTAIRAGQGFSKLVQLQSLFPSVQFAPLHWHSKLVFHARLYQMSVAGRYELRHGFLFSDSTLLLVSLPTNLAEDFIKQMHIDRDGRQLNWSDFTVFRQCSNPVLLTLCAVIDGALRSKVEEEQRERTANSLLGPTGGAADDEDGNSPKTVESGVSSVSDEIDDELGPERFALQKAMQLVAAGKMSEEELMLMQQKVLDSTEDKILAQEAATGKVSANGGNSHFAGFALTDPLCGFQLWGENESFYAATDSRTQKVEWIRHVSQTLVQGGIVDEEICCLESGCERGDSAAGTKHESNIDIPANINESDGHNHTHSSMQIPIDEAASLQFDLPEKNDHLTAVFAAAEALEISTGVPAAYRGNSTSHTDVGLPTNSPGARYHRAVSGFEPRTTEICLELSSNGHAELTPFALGKVAPILTPWHATASCQRCGQAFGVLSNRRRHCGVCGRLLCWTCKHGAGKDAKLKVEVAAKERYPCTSCKLDLHLIHSDVGSGLSPVSAPNAGLTILTPDPLEDDNEALDELPVVSELLRQKLLDGKISQEEYNHMCKVPAPLLGSNSHTAGSRASLRLDSWRRSSRHISSMRVLSSAALVSRLRSESAIDSSENSGGPAIHRANTFHGRPTSLPLSSPQPTSLVRDAMNSGLDDESSTFTIGTKVRLHPDLHSAGTEASEMLEGTVLALNGDKTLSLQVCNGESSWVETNIPQTRVQHIGNLKPDHASRIRLPAAGAARLVASGRNSPNSHHAASFFCHTSSELGLVAPDVDKHGCAKF
eukprot:INCI2780.1.p1 GENE.INCI2780.1~~INCI2780.1.p1  ORF type:complete len:1232 (+),score=191.27 INCI2780.1:247-3942(+)